MGSAFGWALPRFGTMRNGTATKSDERGALPDEALARQLQNGDTEAFTQLVERYQRLVINVAYRMVGDPDLAQDIAQDVFINVYQRIEQFDTRRRFYSWLYRITVNAALHERRRPATTSLNELPVEDHRPQPDELAERAEGDRELRAALATLNERERTVIGLRYGADLSYDEIADILQVPLGTAKTWLFRAKQRLADVMERGAA